MKEWSYTSTLLWAFVACDRVNFTPGGTWVQPGRHISFNGKGVARLVPVIQKCCRVAIAYCHTTIYDVLAQGNMATCFDEYVSIFQGPTSRNVSRVA